MKNSTLALLLSLLFLITFGQGKNQMQLKQTKDRTIEKKNENRNMVGYYVPFLLHRKA